MMKRVFAVWLLAGLPVLADSVSATRAWVSNRVEEARAEWKGDVAAATNPVPSWISAATNGLPGRIAAVTNGLPERIAAVTNGLPERIAAVTNGLPERIAAVTNGLPERVEGLETGVNAATGGLWKAVGDVRDGLGTATNSLWGAIEDISGATADLGAYAKTNDIPVRTSQLVNDSGFITNHTDTTDLAKASGVFPDWSSKAPDLWATGEFCTWKGLTYMRSGVGDGSTAPDISPASWIRSDVREAIARAQPDLVPLTNGLPERIAAVTNGLPERIASVTNGLPEAIIASTNPVPSWIAAATNGLPELVAAATNGLPELIVGATNGLPATVSALVQSAVTGLDSKAATRLVSADGSRWIDGVGAVWQVVQRAAWNGNLAEAPVGAASFTGDGWALTWTGDGSGVTGTWNLYQTLSENGPLVAHYTAGDLPYEEGMPIPLSLFNCKVGETDAEVGQKVDSGWYQIADSEGGIFSVSPLVTTALVMRVTNHVDRLALAGEVPTTNAISSIAVEAVTRPLPVKDSEKPYAWYDCVSGVMLYYDHDSGVFRSDASPYHLFLDVVNDGDNDGVADTEVWSVYNTDGHLGDVSIAMDDEAAVIDGVSDESSSSFFDLTLQFVRTPIPTKNVSGAITEQSMMQMLPAGPWVAYTNGVQYLVVTGLVDHAFRIRREYVGGYSSWDLYDSDLGFNLTESKESPVDAMEITWGLDGWAYGRPDGEGHGVTLTLRRAATNIYGIVTQAGLNNALVDFTPANAGGGGGTFANLTTNDVCNIVTNEVTVVFSPWTVYRDGVDVTAMVQQPWYDATGEGYGFITWIIAESLVSGDTMGAVGAYETEGSGETATGLEWMDMDELHQYTATRSRTVRNALGLARLKDLELLPSYETITNMVHDVTKEVGDAALLAIYYPEGNVTSVDQITTEGLEYSYDATNMTATLTNGFNATGDIVIPWKVTKDGVEYTVTRVGFGAFSPDASGTDITSLIAPTTVKIIEDEAFYHCSSLKSVSLPSVTDIADIAFMECSVLTDISIPSVKTVGVNSLGMCSALTSVALPSITSIGDDAFFGCESLSSVSFGLAPRDAVPTLGSGAYVFDSVPTSCKFIIPLGMYDEWIAADGWKDLYAAGHNFMGYANAADVVSAPVVSAPVVTNIVRTIISTSGRYLWDEDASVCYRLNVQNGFIDLVAVTNINVNLPGNEDALLAVEEAWRNR